MIKQPEISAAANVMQLDQINRQYYKIDGYMIQMIDDSPFWNQFIFNYQIPYQSPSEFSTEIQRSANRLIMIGVLDYNQRKNQLYSHDSDSHATCYYGHNTKVFPAGGFQGGGFREGQIVTVKINRGENKISWWVNGIKQAELIHEMLGNKQVVVMPFVQMNGTNDIVGWKFP